MGMDLHSVQGSEYFHFNWFGWQKVCAFLDSLDCDLSRFSGSNDGDIVPASHCKAITKRIKVAWHEGSLVEGRGLFLNSNFHEFCSLFVGTENACPPHLWKINFNKNTIKAPENPLPDTLKEFLRALDFIKAPKEELPLAVTETGYVGAVIEARLTSKEPIVALRDRFHFDCLEKRVLMDESLSVQKALDSLVCENIHLKSEGSRLKYYLEFSDFLEKCSKLRGFKQC